MIAEFEPGVFFANSPIIIFTDNTGYIYLVVVNQTKVTWSALENFKDDKSAFPAVF